MTAVEAFIFDLPPKQQVLFQYLHDLMMAQPEVVSKIRYRIPFYYRKTWICYLNPIKTEAVEMAFVRANELSNEQGLLDFKKRQQVAGLTINHLDDIPEERLFEVIQEALLLDETTPYASKRKSKK
ncbi:MAG: DUF1801 domain-containing protein [Bacteroidota bacterium]